MVSKRGTPLHVTVSRSDSELAKTPFPAVAAAGFQSCQRTAILRGPSAIRFSTVDRSSPKEATFPWVMFPLLKWVSVPPIPNATPPFALIKPLPRFPPQNRHANASFCWQKAPPPRLSPLPPPAPHLTAP